MIQASFVLPSVFVHALEKPTQILRIPPSPRLHIHAFGAFPPLNRSHIHLTSRSIASPKATSGPSCPGVRPYCRRPVVHPHGQCTTQGKYRYVLVHMSSAPPRSADAPVRQRLLAAAVSPLSSSRSHAPLLVPPTSPFSLAQVTTPNLFSPTLLRATSRWLLSGVCPWNSDARHRECCVPPTYLPLRPVVGMGTL